MDLENDSIIEEVTHSKTKKLKQARLTFSKICPSKPLSDNVSSKKRKLESPRENKTAKIIKIAAKENSADEIEVIDKVANETKTSSSNKSYVETIDIDDEEEKTLDKSERQDKDRSNKSRSKRSLFSKSKKKESLSSSTSLTKFLIKKNSEDDRNTSMEDNAKEKLEQSYVSSSQNSNENSDKDSNIMDDDILEIKINDDEMSEISDNTEPQQFNKSLCTNSDSDVSFDNEYNTKESEKKETTNLNVKDSGTSTQTTEKTDVTKNIKTTPKELRKQESTKKRKERELLRLEKERKREEERENRRKEKEEKRKEKEEKERVEREQKKKERKQKELKKQMEIEQKQKEKEAKEQERRKREEAREEERKRKEEEKLEVERKMQKAVSTFASFFVPKKQEIKSTEEENNTDVQTFMPFEIKADMRIAPICRRNLEKNKKLSLENKLNKGVTETSNLYLAEIKDKKIIRHKSEKTWPLETKNNDIIILDEEDNDNNSGVLIQPETTVDKTRPKLLQFHENRRPPYWGTWRKQSDNINPRRPFSKDSKWFDYEVDSDEEWEEEEPGESLHGSEDEKDEENTDDNEYEVDNEFIVPHGYLSDEEARPGEEEEEEDISMTPETQKHKLKILGEQFEEERKAKTFKLKPRIIGCIWLGPNNVYPVNTPKQVTDFLTVRHAWIAQIPAVISSSVNENTESESALSRLQTPGSTRKKKVPEEALPDLVRLIHGNTHGKNFLVKEFLTFWNKQTASKDNNQISKTSLVTKIGELGKWMACPDEGQMHLKACWYVSEDFRKKYIPEDEELVLPNRWKYNLTPKRKSEINLDDSDKAEKLEKDVDRDKKKVPLITQFTKKITQEEMQRQLETEPKQKVKPKPILQRPPKRAVLIPAPKYDKNEIPVVKIE